ncbi:60S RIBOSOMAL PROTEIN L31 [Encephalitozoon cuniculi GB-M1]|uniref:Large ribosomal subunit protein eL31 n=2 Tax=Encephalitozoon cuniculi TaxID=6035 RepID=RL31_ENCCU|nr:ribosomal protein L31e domain-containing protein [Encephalitozoon cuniculi GB-M1]Q8SSC8.1 RecName: Full=Large ribosomal subunit protein eL31; AltName: Full=60S ribosomal protein L31 [Encephalitozoon cuniculi GB-M1]7QEP_O1 Chain O1, 60S ribosomal protein L31 [Encephalitozoon cuniculi GB-M1]AGE96571.1 60S ribosomal protein l31 [Encephalitozoon cuniculi]KMV66386.1 60S ribosomal protein L31e [Encephalitozoon cuniculi EcunIII-L]UYI28012.1 ribosomal protein L31e [Encephalitozoon cuniculi]CAD2616
MWSKIEENQTVEMTVNLRRICSRLPWTKKASKVVRMLKREIQKHFREEIGVVVTNDLNNFLYSRGIKKIPNKVRVRVTKETSLKNAEENVLKTDLVVVGSFKNLKEVIVDQ